MGGVGTWEGCDGALVDDDCLRSTAQTSPFPRLATNRERETTLCRFIASPDGRACSAQGRRKTEFADVTKCNRRRQSQTTPRPFHSLAFPFLMGKVPNREDFPALGFPHLRLFANSGGHTRRYIESLLLLSDRVS